MNKNKSQVIVFYSGHVQGVGFRYCVCSIARKYDITGYVRNLSDGRVELCAEGQDDQLVNFLNDIHSSHLKNYFSHSQKQWSDYTGRFNSFALRY